VDERVHLVQNVVVENNLSASAVAAPVLADSTLLESVQLRFTQVVHAEKQASEGASFGHVA
jgi:hypothetical protein